MTLRKPRADGQGGFSMVEVMLALALLGAVLVSITSLFIIGGKRVAQGRERTEALSVATHVMEDIDQISYRGIYTVFNSGATDPGAATGPLTIDSRTHADAPAAWQTLIDSKLKNSYAVVEIERVGGTDFRSATALRVTTTVYWDDLNKTRNITLETVRF